MNATLISLPEAWRARATELRRWAAADSAAKAYEVAANELEEALRTYSDEVLSLTQAADESGYSTEHLRRLVRDGRIPNAGRKNAPKVRRGDVPKRPKSERQHRGGYDPIADARALLSRRKNAK